MIVFGGFNGSYFNDLYYLDLLDDGFNINKPTIQHDLVKILGSQLHSDIKFKFTDDRII